MNELAGVFDRWCRNDPDRDAYVFVTDRSAQVLSRRDLATSARALAQELREEVRDEVIVVEGVTSAHAIVAIWACVLADACFTVIPPRTARASPLPAGPRLPSACWGGTSALTPAVATPFPVISRRFAWPLPGFPAYCNSHPGQPGSRRIATSPIPRSHRISSGAQRRMCRRSAARLHRGCRSTTTWAFLVE